MVWRGLTRGVHQRATLIIISISISIIIIIIISSSSSSSSSSSNSLLLQGLSLVATNGIKCSRLSADPLQGIATHYRPVFVALVNDFRVLSHPLT